MENCSEMKGINKVWLSYPKQRNKKPKTKFKSLERRLFLEYNPKDNMDLYEEVERKKKRKDPCWKLNGAVESSLPLEKVLKL